MGLFKRKIYGIEVQLIDGDTHLLADDIGKTMEFMTIEGACNSLRLWAEDNRDKYSFCEVVELK